MFRNLVILYILHTSLSFCLFTFTPFHLQYSKVNMVCQYFFQNFFEKIFDKKRPSYFIKRPFLQDAPAIVAGASYKIPVSRGMFFYIVNS